MICFRAAGRGLWVQASPFPVLLPGLRQGSRGAADGGIRKSGQRVLPLRAVRGLKFVGFTGYLQDTSRGAYCKGTLPGSRPL